MTWFSTAKVYGAFFINAPVFILAWSKQIICRIPKVVRLQRITACSIV
jgi:hypothetical protein